MRGIWRGLVARTELTDEDFMRRLRRGIEVHDRLRRPLLAFYLGLALAFIGLLIATFLQLQNMLKQFGNAAQGLVPGFLLGVVVGVSIGLLTVKIVHGLITALMPLRMERLLLHYYDAFRELIQETAEASESTESRP